MGIDVTKLTDESKAVDASTIADGTTPWKHRIVEFMANRKEPAASVEEILKATDPKYNGENLSKRRHCLTSQLTYLRQDEGIVTKTLDDEKIVLLGVKREDKVIPFKNAIKYL